MSYLGFSIIINIFTSFVMGVFVFLKNPKSPLNRTFAYFCVSLFLWSIFYFLCQGSNNETQALFWQRLLMASAVFIPICYLHHVYTLIDKAKEYKFRIILSYLFGNPAKGVLDL